MQEIGDQVRMLSNGYMPVLYVWVEGPLHGAIYQTGNYLDDKHFEFPVFAWCMRRKAEILADWEKGGAK